MNIPQYGQMSPFQRWHRSLNHVQYKIVQGIAFLCFCASSFIGIVAIGYLMSTMNDAPPSTTCVMATHGIVCGEDVGRLR
jgi:hypothetical protein